MTVHRRTEEEVLVGGGVNQVVRIGSTVRRPAGPWTPTVHALLDHLRAAGFTGAPRALGLDTGGREILDFVPGHVASYPLPDYARSDATLRAVAVLLRDYHDATARFTPPPEATWYLPGREPTEVICHGDIAPYNCVFRDGKPIAFIDFDTAHPGPRIWDLAYAAYRFVPLTDPGNGDFALPVEEQARRLGLLADAYQLDDSDRAALADTARERLDALVRHMHEQANAGTVAFAEHVAAGHDLLYRTDAAHIARHTALFTAALSRKHPQQ
ncbi:aminoglycoside phosphotransferase family protein [Kitasatospora sp. GP82]|uniref:phosphotransferase enzyme family protein n=1 Tax=Kitasatospora sp. GP82 TaxID=3035089 RepID=UPI002474AAEE|nr:aminoglycoside phosphotransferase family protein [Kitasatospora sp. GP82]MDH6128267.1 aminoglycoside phosphotransferase (APT) family kinase protein [Kitasatospora sp. GP82]